MNNNLEDDFIDKLKQHSFYDVEAKINNICI